MPPELDGRPDGFYWVRVTATWEVARWIPAKEYWATTDCGLFLDEELIEVGPQVEAPESVEV